MDILKELHASVEEAWGASFDAAYRDLEIKLFTQEAGLKEANENVSVANEARQAAEHRIQELQQEVLALQDALRCHESSLNERAIPMPFANLEDEFAPKYVWGNGLQDGDKLPKILEEKYSALYINMQTLLEGWVGLKRKVLRHRDKLRHWEKQLQRNEFTLMLHGEPVTFQRVHTVDTGIKASNSKTPTSSGLEQPLCQDPKSAESPRVATKPARPAQNDESTVSGPMIKTEPNSQHMAHPISNSPPSLHRERSKSSSDTPQPLPDLQGRKRKRVQQISHAHPIAESPRGPALVKNEPISSSPVQHPLLSTQDLDDIGATVQTPTKRRGDRAVHRESLAPGFDTSHAIVRRDTSDQSTLNAPTLQPIDGNAPNFQLAGQERRARATNYRAPLSMAEDGDTDGVYHEQPSKHTSSSTSALHPAPPRKGIYDTRATESRLQSLLEASTPSKSLLGTSKARTGANQPRGRGTVEPSPVQHPLQSNDAGPEVRPEDEPYRLRPLHCLSLDHFKVNPGRNQGVDFAYDSVTRKKDERKCLSGCTRPGCCGDRFRAMARLGGLSANSPEEQAEEDQRVLEEYLGDDRHLLKRLSAHDRENLLVDARARVLANQYGRHRHSYQRAPSPPGFWRTDMPSTQEMESDREAAQRQEREKVAERYREAMRPGGLWTFADE